MNNSQLSVLLGTCLIPGIAKALEIPNSGIVEFLDKFYRSSLYGFLKEKDTAVWHLSAKTLADIYSEEQKTGILDLPEEQ